jgi:hypothetical protein
MSDVVQKRVDIQVTATDAGASAVFAKVGNAAQAAASRVGSAGGASMSMGPQYGPAVAPRYSGEEAQVRSMMAGRMLAMREQERRQRLANEVNRRMTPDFSGLRETRGEEAMRLRGGMGAGDRAEATRSRTMEQEFKRAGKIAKAVGGAFAVSEFGSNFSQYKEEDRFREALKAGYTRVEAFSMGLADIVPIIGPLARGFRSMGDLIDDLRNPATNDARKRDQDDKDRRRLIIDEQAKRDAARLPMQQAIREGAVSASDRMLLVGERGSSRAEWEANIANKQEMRRIAEQRKAARGWGTAGEAMMPLLDQQAQAAQAEYNDKLKQIAEQRREMLRKIEEDTSATITATTRQGMRDRLEEQGKYHKARILQIQQEGSAEIEELQRQDAEKQRTDPEYNLPREQERLDAKRKQIRNRQVRDTKRENEREQKDAEKQQRDFAARADEQQVNMATRRLRMTGQGAAAEQMELRARYQQQLQEIQQNLDEQVQAHGERAPELRRQAAESARLAGEEYALSLEEAAARRGEVFKADRPAALAGEARALRGVTGQMGPEVTVQRAAQATIDSKKVLDKIEKGIGAMAAALTKAGVQLVIVKGN